MVVFFTIFLLKPYVVGFFVPFLFNYYTNVPTMISLFKRIGLFCLALGVLIGCNSDDNDYSPLAYEAIDDVAFVAQNATVIIDVFANDVNVPTQGQLLVQSVSSGTANVLDPNNTPNDPSDDLLEYTADGGIFGSITLQYALCESGTDNCIGATINVTVTPVSPVNFNLEQFPYDNLSDYNFFEGAMANQEPVYGVLPYEPISTLFTDYALKKRFIWMPDGAQAQYTESYELLQMPVGTILIKTFYYDNVLPAGDTQIIETRLIYRTAEGWEFAEYIWNEAQTEATLNLDGDFTEVNWLQDGVERSINYRIPSQAECFTCHKTQLDPIPIGLKPQHINSDYPYADGIENQLRKLIAMGYLAEGLPAEIQTVIDWRDTSQPISLRMRSYVDINCAHCHSDDRHCDYRPVRFAFNESADNVNLGVCVDPETPIPPNTKIVVPGDIDTSVLFFRVNSEAEEYRMPLLGRTIRDEEAVAMVEAWINSLTESCD